LNPRRLRAIPQGLSSVRDQHQTVHEICTSGYQISSSLPSDDLQGVGLARLLSDAGPPRHTAERVIPTPQGGAEAPQSRTLARAARNARMQIL
jgi:hypothetical protein